MNYEESFGEWWKQNKHKWEPISLDKDELIPESGWYLYVDNQYYILRTNL